MLSTRKSLQIFRHMSIKGNQNKANQNKAELAILISDRADFRARRVIRNKKGHYIKGLILQEDIIIL